VAAGKTALHRIREHINSEKWKPEDAVPDRVEDKIGVGDSVWLKAYGTAGKVLEVNYDSGQIEVIAGAVRFRMRLDEVTRMVDADKAVKKETVHVYTEERAPLEIDLRGRRAEEIEVLLDRYLNDAALSNLKQVRVIHGFGTGVVRSIVREICSTHPLVKSFQSAAAAEGGDGATLIQLK
jgi:DNA mismatch repair protein MutS2